MLEKPQVAKTTAQPIAFIRVTVPRSEIRQVMGPGCQELFAAVAAQGSAPAGPWFTHHLRMDPQVFDFEISVPVVAPIAPKGRVRAGERPAVRVVRSVYQGPYEGLGAAWGEFDAWIAAEGHRAGPELWECYVVGPESSPDPAAYRTELSRPLLR